MQAAAQEAIAELDLEKYAALFVGDYAGPQNLTDLLHQGWDLARHRPALPRHGLHAVRYEEAAAALEAKATIALPEAFVTYLGVVDHWRNLPFRDPGLPGELLLADWSAPQAVALFERLVALLEGRALAHAASCWPRHAA